MPKFQDLTGQQFGRYTVISRAENKSGNIMWLCLCECRTEKIIQDGSLKRGTTRSCGCLKREAVTKANTKHGHTRTGQRTPEYRSWGNAQDRCTNPKNDNYPFYGALGVTICDRWRGENGFENFITDLGERPQGTTLGRFGDVGNYQPGNCKWMTQAEQVANWRPDRNRGGRPKKRILEPIAA